MRTGLANRQASSRGEAMNAHSLAFRLFGAGLLSLAIPAWSQNQPASPSTTPATSLGRLFFTPAQRAILDRQRLTGFQAPAHQGMVTINGQMHRSGGQTTTWLNGEAVSGIAPPAGRVGETIDRDNGQRKDVLNGGRIVVTPGRP